MLLGVTIGGAITAAGVRMISGLLYGVSPYDPITFGIAVVISTLMALSASLVPARRAMRMSPIAALRS